MYPIIHVKLVNLNVAVVSIILLLLVIHAGRIIIHLIIYSLVLQYVQVFVHMDSMHLYHKIYAYLVILTVLLVIILLLFV